MAGKVSKNQRPTGRGAKGAAQVEVKEPYVVVNRADIRQHKYLQPPGREISGVEKAHAIALSGEVPPLGPNRERLEFVAIPLDKYLEHRDSDQPVSAESAGIRLRAA